MITVTQALACKCSRLYASRFSHESCFAKSCLDPAKSTRLRSSSVGLGATKANGAEHLHLHHEKVCNANAVGRFHRPPNYLSGAQNVSQEAGVILFASSTPKGQYERIRNENTNVTESGDELCMSHGQRLQHRGNGSANIQHGWCCVQKKPQTIASGREMRIACRKTGESNTVTTNSIRCSKR